MDLAGLVSTDVYVLMLEIVLAYSVFVTTHACIHMHRYIHNFCLLCRYCADVYTNTLGPIYASDASLSAVSMMDDGFKHTGVINVRLNGRSTRTRATLTECGSIKGEARDSQYTSRFNSKDAYIHYTTHNNRRTHGGATGPGGGGGSGGAGDDDGYEDGNGRNHDSDGDISSSVNYDMGRAIDGINIDLDVSSDSKSMSMQYIVHDGKREKETLRQVREHNSKKMSDEERKKTRTHAPVHPHANIAKTLAHTNLLHAKRDDGDHSIHTGTNIHTTHTNRRSQNHISGDHSDGSDDDGAVVSGLKARYVFTSSIIHRAVEDEDKRLHVYLCKPGELRADYFSADSGANDDHDHAERKDRSGVQYTNSRTNESESDETYTTHGSEHNDGHRENHGDSTRNARDSGDACIDPSLAILHSFLCYQLNPDRLVQLSTERYIADNPNINKLLVPTMQVPSAP